MVRIGPRARGAIAPVLCPGWDNIDGDFYREKCLKQALLHFLTSNYPSGGHFPRPDPAPVHDARATAILLAGAEVPTVAREINPPAVPQLRPIEIFWGMFGQEAGA